MLYQSTGRIRYSIEPRVGYKVILEVDQGIADYYRSLIPKTRGAQRQGFPAHISVVRKQTPPNMEAWRKYEGENIRFVYNNIVYYDEVYYWINAYSRRLEEIRIELGLPVYDSITAPPDHNQSFHVTIGNCKGLS